MTRTLPIFALLFAALPAAGADLPDAPKPPAGFPAFKVQEIDSGLKIGYAVIVADIDGDKKPDIAVVDQHKIVWYQNPTWKKRVVLDGKTKPDNVCIAALDIDGDGLPELVVGAAWKPFDTKTAATLQWLKRGKTLDDEWTMHAIPCEEPTVHRVRAFDTDGDGKPEIVLAPLMGRDATKEKNWLDGRPVRIVSYKVPAKDPEKPENWKATVLNEDLHVVHNFQEAKGAKSLFYAVSYEGLHRIAADKDGKWGATKIGEGDQSTPKASRGASEVATGARHIADERRRSVPIVVTPDAFAATIEPWHGNRVAVYERGDEGKPWTRTVIDEQLRWGHAVKFAKLMERSSLIEDQADHLIVGVRDNPDPKQGDTFAEKRGVRIYRFDGKAKTWERYILEDGGVAVEDLAVADLDGDGRPDIIAVGRATGNCRIYWNRGAAK